MEVKGIDISFWQGDFDMEEAKNDGFEFVIIKAGGSDDGFYTDSEFENNYRKAKAAGMGVGAYYFVGSGCITAEDGKADALRFIDIIAGKQFDYPVYMDVESIDPADRAGATEAAIAFCKTMESYGYYVGIYGSEYSTFESMLDKSKLTEFDIWCANYDDKPDSLPYGMWQYSSSNHLDKNICYKDYPTIIKNAGLNGYKTVGKQETPKIKAEPQKQRKKTVDELVKEVMAGKWGNGDEREKRLEAAGYDYDAVQEAVNALYNIKSEDDEEVWYTVEEGDTLSSIADEYDTDYMTIAELNGLDDPDLIYPGQELRIK